MKFNPKTFVFTLLTALSSLAGTSYASEPLPMVPGDPEHITVHGERINPHFTEGSLNPFIPRSGSVSVGGAASPAKVNANGKAKAREKKEQSEKGENNFWKDITAVVLDKTGIKNFLDSLAKEGQVEARKTSMTRTFDGNGHVTTETLNCFELGNSSNNKMSCAQIMAIPTQNGLRIEFHRLIVYGGKLVYSTDDTIAFEVANIDELYQNLNEIDSSISL